MVYILIRKEYVNTANGREYDNTVNRNSLW